MFRHHGVQGNKTDITAGGLIGTPAAGTWSVYYNGTNVSSYYDAYKEYKSVKFTVVTFAEFKDSAGNVIAHYSQNNGWTMVGSPSENARESEFNSIYNDAWYDAYYNRGSTANTRSTGRVDTTGSTFNMFV